MRQYQVVLSYATTSESAEEAVRTALAAIDARSSAYVEVFAEGREGSIIEGEIGYDLPVTLED